MALSYPLVFRLPGFPWSAGWWVVASEASKRLMSASTCSGVSRLCTCFSKVRISAAAFSASSFRTPSE